MRPDSSNSSPAALIAALSLLRVIGSATGLAKSQKAAEKLVGAVILRNRRRRRISVVIESAKKQTLVGPNGVRPGGGEAPLAPTIQRDQDDSRGDRDDGGVQDDEKTLSTHGKRPSLRGASWKAAVLVFPRFEPQSYITTPRYLLLFFLWRRRCRWCLFRW